MHTSNYTSNILIHAIRFQIHLIMFNTLDIKIFHLTIAKNLIYYLIIFITVVIVIAKIVNSIVIILVITYVPLLNTFILKKL